MFTICGFANWPFKSNLCHLPHSLSRLSFRRRDDDRRQRSSHDRDRDRSDRDRDYSGRDRDHEYENDRAQDNDRPEYLKCPPAKHASGCQQGSPTACSNEQFLSSILPLLSALKSKQNFLARIQIQKALYDAIDEEDSSDDQCCPPVVKKKSSSNYQDQHPSRGSQHRRNSWSTYSAWRLKLENPNADDAKSEANPHSEITTFWKTNIFWKIKQNECNS